MSVADVVAGLVENQPRAGRAFLTRMIPRTLPVTRGLGLKVEALDDEHCDVAMPFGRKAKNHVGGMYLGVLMIVAEVAMATYVMRICRPDRFSTLVKRTTGEFTKQSKERVIARCQPDPELRQRILEAKGLAPGEKAAFLVEVDVLFAQSGDAMGKAGFEISVMRRKSKA